ncbi:MAG: hypothetical protein ACRC5A_05450, partial [Enterobacteriaceae bacterium]
MSANLASYVCISCSDLLNSSQEHLDEVKRESGIALDNLFTGLRSVGSLMFWAAANPDYPTDIAMEDMRNLG